MRGGGRGDHTSQILDDLCALISTVLRSHLPLAAAAPLPLRRRPKLSPAGVAALLLGVSLALILCGSVTFVIGFIMMPWVLGMVMLFYFVGVLSSISWIGRAVLCPSASPSSSSKEITAAAPPQPPPVHPPSTPPLPPTPPPNFAGFADFSPSHWPINGEGEKQLNPHPQIQQIPIQSPIPANPAKRERRVGRKREEEERELRAHT